MDREVFDKIYDNAYEQGVKDATEKANKAIDFIVKQFFDKMPCIANDIKELFNNELKK